GGYHGGTQGEPEQPPGGCVCDPLGAGGGVLRLGHQALDPGQGRVIPDRGNFDAQAGGGGDRPGHDPVPRRGHPGSASARDSAVTMDSSTSARPSRITPSAGTLAPGRTSTRSPRRSSEGETLTSSSPSIRSA